MSTFYNDPTELTKLRDDILTADSSEEWDHIGECNAAAVQDDYDKRYQHLRASGTAALTFTWTDAGGAEKEEELSIQNIYNAIKADQVQVLNEIVRAYRSSQAKTDQIRVMGKTITNMKTKAANIMRNEVAAINARLEGKKSELNVALDEVTTRNEEVEALQQQVLQLTMDLQTEKDARSKEFDAHTELNQRFDGLKKRILNGEVDASSVPEGGTRSGSSHTKMPNPKDLKDNATSTEYKHWKSSVELKIDAEELGLVAQKALIMISVSGEASKNALMILPQTLAKTYAELTKEDLYAALDNRFSDPFEEENARQSFKILIMKPYQDFTEFKNDFEYKAAASGLTSGLQGAENISKVMKREMVDRLYSALERGLAREVGDHTITYQQFCNAATALSRTYKKTWHEDQRKRRADNEKRQKEASNSNGGHRQNGGSNTNTGGGQSQSNSNSNSRPNSSSGNGYSGNGYKRDTGFQAFKDFGLTFEEAVQLTRDKKCFKCKQSGHQQRDCKATAITALQPSGVIAE